MSKRKYGIRPPAKCGTDGGYYRHTRTLRTPACEDCLKAHAAAEKARRDRQDPSRVERRALARKRVPRVQNRGLEWELKPGLIWRAAPRRERMERKAS